MLEQVESAPYAPVGNVLTVIRRLRERGLPEMLAPRELERVGIPPGNAPRTLAALRFLGLIDDEGSRTPAFERLRRATTEEYPEILGEIIQGSYQPVFTILDPAQATEIQLHDAFRHYRPDKQRERMITLFLGLCREAGLVPGGPPQRKSRVRRTAPDSPGLRREQTVVKTEPTHASAHAPSEFHITQYEMPASLDALLRDLSTLGPKWTTDEKERWVATFLAVLSYAYPEQRGGDANS